MTPNNISDEERAKREERRRKHRERIKRKRQEKWDAIDDEKNVAVDQMKSPRGHDGTPAIKHGYYRKHLEENEAEHAEQIAAMIRDNYKLDSVVDEMELFYAVSSFVKSLRPEPPVRDGDKNVRSHQAYWARQFKEFIQDLGLSRSKRNEDDSTDDIARALAAMTGGLRKKQRERGDDDDDDAEEGGARIVIARKESSETPEDE